MRGREYVEFGREICQEYLSAGLAITLRQLYYQGVARGLLASSQKVYKALGKALSKARLDGDFPLHWLTDRTRVLHSGDFTRCDTKVERALDRAAERTAALPDQLLWRDRWFGQDYHVSVLFEKEALSGIFEDVCNRHGISWMACKGDPSHSALFDWLKDAAAAHGVGNPGGWKDAQGNNHKGMAKRSVILYFGDHDPTGVRIPRTIENTLNTFQGHLGLDFPIEVRRVALSIPQALERGVPPFWAKQSGKDYKKYVREFGTEKCWELDAIEPRELMRMVEDTVDPLFDKDLARRLQKDVEKRRETMRIHMRSEAWHRAATFGEA